MEFGHIAYIFPNKRQQFQVSDVGTAELLCLISINFPHNTKTIPVPFNVAKVTFFGMVSKNVFLFKGWRGDLQR